jgi:predicted ATPase/class 3 adenylate cyclase
MADRAPEGIITLMFTDIKGSTGLWETMGDRFRPVLDRHNGLIRELIQRWDGYEVKSQGDSFMVAFGRATDAVQCALDIQRTFAQEPWPEAVGELLVRIGIHTGEPFLGYDPAGRPDYFGPVVNRAARVEMAGHGGQTLITHVTHDTVEGALTTDVELRDLGRHRLRGLEQPELLFEVRHPDLPPREFPPLRTLDTLRTNLPVNPSTFVGREQELANLRRLLNRSETRLLTLFGFGGMGKTRTALQLAEICAADFQEGVWWIELEEVTHGEGMVQRIADRLSIHLQPQPSVREQLWSYLHDREALLVLDNTEQIPDAPRVVNELLRAAPKVKCIVTTRKALELQAEQLVEIRPLAGSEAERLFVDRARTRKEDFDLTPENRADVAELCRRLEGVPLAIELAASRIVGMTPREILSRLNERFRLLQSRSPHLPPRQRALRGAIDWSYDLLAEEDQSLLAQLSVFAGGFTLAHAEEVCDAFDVFEGVQELRRHSLLSAETDASTQSTRYGMLESVREYAMEKLREFPDEGAAVRQAHADYFLRFGEERAALRRTREEAQALDELGGEFDNLRAGMNWAQSIGEGRVCGRLALALYEVLYCRGFWAEARRRLETGLQAVEQEPDDTRELRAKLLHFLSGISLDMGDTGGAQALAERSLALYRELADPLGTAAGLNLVGYIAAEREEVETTRQLFEEALDLLPPQQHWRQAIVLHNLARLASRAAQPEEARRLYEQALEHRRAAGDTRGEAETLGNLGAIAHIAGDYPAANRLYHQSLELRRAVRDRHGIAVMLHNLGELAEAEGDLQRAAALFINAERIFLDLPSAFVSAPRGFLRKLEDRLGAERWAEVRAAAERQPWEELV